MEAKLNIFTALVVLLSVYLSFSILFSSGRTADDILGDVQTPQIAVQRADELKQFMKRKIINVTDNVYVAQGYSLGNSIMLEGPQGLIIIDSTEHLDSARDILNEFRKICPDKPIKAIIYTHSHPDHTYGTLSFIEDPENPPDIWAHESLFDQIKGVSTIGQIFYKRASRQFGLYLPERIHDQVGIKLKFDKTAKTSIVFPNRLVKGQHERVNIAGIELDIYHTPGETDDHITIFLPDKGVAFPGDNFYAAFPNLYAIRGTPVRDVMRWVAAIDFVIELNPQYLVPSHTYVIQGKEKIRETLTYYRDAVQFVHDQTVRFMNMGMHPNDIVQKVSLPEHMAEKDFLQPWYGTVAWSVKGVFDAYMGWFSGDIAELAPMGTHEKAEKMVQLAGGRKTMLKKAERAFDENQYAWALELASYLFKLDRDDEKARDLRLKCLKMLATQQTSTNGRNYYLAQTLEDHDLVDAKLSPVTMIQRMPMDMLFSLLPTRFKAEECSTVNRKAIFHFTDTNETFSLHMRNGIMALGFDSSEVYDLKLSTTSQVWRDILSKQMSPVKAYASGDIIIEGGVLAFRSFMACIEQQN